MHVNTNTAVPGWLNVHKNSRAECFGKKRLAILQHLPQYGCNISHTIWA